MLELYLICYTMPMKIEQIIKLVLDEDVQKITKIETGLTNHNYAVKTNLQTVVLRLPKEENEHLFNYINEQDILDKVKPLDIDAELIYYDSETGIKISKFIKNAHVYHDRYIERAAILIKKLHGAKLHSNETFIVLNQFDLFQVDNPIYDLSVYRNLLAGLEIENPILCHNDLVQGNLLFTEKKSYLIDYEYAMNNDPYFDIMSFITENDIMDPHLRKLFYDNYFNSTTEINYQKLDSYEIAHQILWCQWACMMYKFHNEPVYKEIADLKYKRLIQKITAQ